MKIRLLCSKCGGELKSWASFADNNTLDLEVDPCPDRCGCGEDEDE